MDTVSTYSRAFRVLSWSVVAFAIFLVWLGAATTTMEAGMIFADWPLSMGSYNPPGWLENIFKFLEHSHRLIAQVVGMLVLAMFSWAFVRSGKQAAEVLGLVVLLALTLAIFIVAGSEREDLARKQTFLWIGLALSALPIAWLVWSWRKRGWPLVTKLSALALLMVVTQAILGGLRVTEISDAFAVAHGCFAQVFFCVLILIAMACGSGWESTGFRAPLKRVQLVRVWGSVFTGLVLLQLILGAKMRHFHRSGIPDEGLFLTQGQFVPEFSDPIIAVLFFHKLTAYTIFVVALIFSLRLFKGRKLGDGRDWKWMHRILLLIFIQVGLGFSVIATGKSFWVTNVHVLNGLAILALSFVFSVRAWRGRALESESE